MRTLFRKLLGWLPVCLASFLIAFPASLWADVIPARVNDPRDRSAARVEARLSDLGVSAGALSSGPARIAPGDAAYFAQDPGRVQMVSGLDVDQWAGAAALLIAIPAIVYFGGRAATIFGD